MNIEDAKKVIETYEFSKENFISTAEYKAFCEALDLAVDTLEKHIPKNDETGKDKQERLHCTTGIGVNNWSCYKDCACWDGKRCTEYENKKSENGMLTQNNEKLISENLIYKNFAIEILDKMLDEFNEDGWCRLVMKKEDVLRFKERLKLK